MTDRRYAARERAYQLVDVHDRDGRFVGYLADVSEGGLRLSRVADPGLLDLERLTLVLPAWLGLSGELELPGRFVWKREGEDGCEAGFSFDELTTRKARTLADLLALLTQVMQESAADAGE